MKSNIEAREKVQELGKTLAKYPIRPETFTYIDLYQNIQSLYYMEEYDLVYSLCDLLVARIKDN